MQKNLKKVHFLQKYWLENIERVTKPLKFFVQRISFDMCVIIPDFKKNRSIRFKNSFLAFEGHFLQSTQEYFDALKTKIGLWGKTFQKRCVTLVTVAYFNAFFAIENFLIFTYF